jgi:hypothetical protein
MKNSRTIFIVFEELKNIENRVAWFLAELCKAEKGVQKDKRYQRRLCDCKSEKAELEKRECDKKARGLNRCLTAALM